MRKILFFTLSIVIVSLAGVSCNNSQTAQDMLNRENKATRNFIRNHHLQIVTTFPSDSVFGANVYYLTPDGVYIHIIDYGTGDTLIARREAYVRFDSIFYYETSDTTAYPYSGTDGYGLYPITFNRGIAYSYQTYGCQAFDIALHYVRHDGRVNMIVPSAYGTSTNQSSFIPVFYKDVIFRYD